VSSGVRQHELTRSKTSSIDAVRSCRALGALSLFIGFSAQASSPNYLRLFLTILPFAVVDAALVVFLLVSKEKARLWIAALPAILGFASYAEMACRVFLGIRLL